MSLWRLESPGIDSRGQNVWPRLFPRETGPTVDFDEDSDSSEDEEPEDSAEYQSFCQHSGQLFFLIRRNPEKFAEDLFSAHIVSDRVLSDIRRKRRRAIAGIINMYSDKKAKKLLNVVKKLIQADPGKFEALLTVMSQCSHSMATMAEKLQHSCGKVSFQTKFLVTTRKLKKKN